MAILDITILIVVSLCYFGAAVLNLMGLLGEPASVRKRAALLTQAGFALQTVGLVILSISLGRIPFYHIIESLAVVSWALVLIYLLVERQYSVIALGVFVNTVALVLSVLAGLLPHEMSVGVPPMLRSPWSAPHILSSLLAYASFFLAFGASLIYLLQERMLRAKRITALQRHLPSLDVADRLSYRLVAFGFPMLTLGIVTGSVWAESAWGRYWGWDPKETWALATWLVYAAYMHVRIVSSRRGKWPNRLLVAGFCFIVFTYIGVNFLGTGLHRYITR